MKLWAGWLVVVCLFVIASADASVQNSWFKLEVFVPEYVQSDSPVEYRIVVTNVSGENGDPRTLSNFTMIHRVEYQEYVNYTIPPTSTTTTPPWTEIQWNTLPPLESEHYFIVEGITRTQNLTGLTSIQSSITVRHRVNDINYGLTINSQLKVGSPPPPPPPPTTLYKYINFPGHHQITDTEEHYHGRTINAPKPPYKLCGQAGQNPSNTGCMECKCIEGQGWKWVPCGFAGGICGGAQCWVIARKVADPVYLNNLEFLWSMAPLEIPGQGMPYRLECFYRSRIAFHGPFGQGWESNVNMRVVPHPTEADQVIFYDGTGRGDSVRRHLCRTAGPFPENAQNER